jgi:two-component system nitrate/nitrite response regulator NarL
MGVRATLASNPCVQVAGEATNFVQAIRTVMEVQPHLIVTAPMLGGASPTEFVEALHLASPQSRILIITSGSSPDDCARLVQLGVVGYLRWDDVDCNLLSHCIMAVADGSVVIRSLAIEAAKHQAPSDFPDATNPEQITPRQRAILRRMAEGLTRDQIAHVEHLTIRTVNRAIEQLRTDYEAPSTFVLGMRLGRYALAS